MRNCFFVVTIFSLAIERISGRLLWEEEFNKLRSRSWEVLDLENSFNNELQYYTSRSENVRVEGGELIITPLRENFGSKQYTSGRLYSKFAWKYGRVEVRAKLPNGFGLWPAIWMLSKKDKHGGWPQSGEIDIVEARGQELNIVQSAIHFGGECCSDTRSESSGRLDVQCSVDQYHVYTLDWTPTELVFRLDGNAFYRRDLDRILHEDYDGKGKPFDEKFHLILNVAVGGHFLDDPTPETEWSYPDAEMRVDWIRVYSLDEISTSVCVAKPDVTPKKICNSVRWACGGKNDDLDLEAECAAAGCCDDHATCDVATIYDLATEVFTGFHQQTGRRKTCDFRGRAEVKFTLNDPGPAPSRCEVSPSATNGGLCGATNWACFSQDFADVSVPCNSPLRSEVLACCGADPATCDHDNLRAFAQGIFQVYYDAIPRATSCDFSGNAVLVNPLTPLPCTSGFDS